MARRLGTRVSTTADITPLLARRWYADPARDLAERFASLDRDGELLKLVRSADATEGRRLIREKFGDEPFSDEIIHRLLLCRELTEKDDWADYLIAAVGDPDRLGNPQFEVLATMILRRRGTTRNDRRVFERIRRFVLEELGPKSDAMIPVSTFAAWTAEVATVDPTAILQRLKSTRGSAVSSHMDEIISWRLAAAAWANFSLGRKGAARALLERIITLADRPTAKRDREYPEPRHLDDDVDLSVAPWGLGIDEILQPVDLTLLRRLDGV